MSLSEGNFPKQNIPDNLKTSDWCKQNILAILSYQNYTTKFNRERKKDYENYLLFNGVFDSKTFEYVTNTYGISSPARLVNFPIIAPKIEVIVGEFMANELEYTVEAINEDAISRKLEKKYSLLTEKLVKPFREELSKITGIEFEGQEFGQEIPEDIEKFMKYNFREQSEVEIFHAINYLNYKYHLKHTFKQGLYDLCITSKGFYNVYVKNGDPFIRRVDPRSLIYDINTESETLQDSQWVAEERFLSVNEIIDEFSDYLSQDDVIKIEELRTQGHDSLSRYNKPYQWYYKDDSNSPLRIRVVTGVWKSLRTLNFKISENKHDPDVPFRKWVGDDYKIQKGDKIEKKTVTDIWEATMIGHEIVVKARRMPNQIRREDNYANAKLPYIGIIKNNIDGITLSIVDSLKNVQILYNIVMYHIELALARSGGKAVVYDVSQKPVGLSLDDVFYHAKNSGVIPINSKQEGQLHGSGFNQFQQVDFTLSNSVSQLMNLKMMLEQTAETLSGINRSREGFNKTDAVGVNERNVVQSSLITMPLMANHSRTIEMCYQYASDLMKICWEEGKKINYFFGDAAAKFFEISKDFKNDDYGIFIRNTTKEQKDKQTMIQLGQNALASGGIDFLNMIKIINSETAKDAEVILEQAIDVIKKQQAQQQQAMVQAEQSKAQAIQQQAQIEAQTKQAELQTKIQVAQIEAEAMMNVAKMKIDGGQESADFRHEHDKKMQILKASNNLSQEAFKADSSAILNQSNMDSQSLSEQKIEKASNMNKNSTNKK